MKFVLPWIVAVFLLPGLEANAAQVVWDANPVEERVTGYIVLFGPLPHDRSAFVSYPHQVDVGPALTFDLAEIESFPDALYLAVVAYNHLGLRSDYSDPVALREESAARGDGGGGGGGCFFRILVSGPALSRPPGRRRAGEN